MSEKGNVKAKTQRQIADEVGVPQSAINRWLTGKVTPKDEALEKLAAAVGKTPESLLLEIRSKRLQRISKKNLSLAA